MKRVENEYQKTFLIKGDSGLDYNELRKIFNANQFNEVIDETIATSIDFIFIEPIEGRLPKINIRCKMKNVLNENKKIITSKDNLYLNMMEKYPKNNYFAKTWVLTERCHFTSFPLIVKPVGPNACAGRDISIVTTKEELITAARKLLKKYKNAIACEYITNPLLFNERKFHLRIYLLVRAIPFFASVCPKGKIITAQNRYRDRDWSKKKIHDTHVASTPGHWFFPDDLTSLTKDQNMHIFTQIEKALLDSSSLLSKCKLTYDECENAYEVFGCDFIVRNNLEVVLIEINDHAMYKSQDYSKNDVFSRYYFEWLWKSLNIKK